ncbi:hypothetical protein E2986_11553, partial [Frieseomelitta varia]
SVCLSVCLSFFLSFFSPTPLSFSRLCCTLLHKLNCMSSDFFDKSSCHQQYFIIRLAHK